jgi:hypothetical protein
LSRLKGLFGGGDKKKTDKTKTDKKNVAAPNGRP